jgi:hypothetical protein
MLVPIYQTTRYHITENRNPESVLFIILQVSIFFGDVMKELNVLCWQAYYRQGVALQCLGRHGDALAAFSSGLAQDPKNAQLLAGLVEASMKSPLRGVYIGIIEHQIV